MYVVDCGPITMGPIITSNIFKLQDISVVNELNDYLTFEGEIAEEISMLCGPQIQEECFNAVSRIPFVVGSVMRTSGGEYAHEIIHAVVCERGKKSDFLDLCDATRNAILLAESGGLSSIIFPAIGSGVGGLTSKEAIFTILEHIQYVVYNANFMFLKNIQFCARNSEELELFQKYFKEIFRNI